MSWIPDPLAGLKTLINNCFSGLEAGIKSSIDAVTNALIQGWGIIVLVAGWVWFVVSHMNGWIADCVTASGAIVIPLIDLHVPSGISNILSISNTFLPLDEAFGFLIIYGGFTVALAIYRNVKSWIPTMSGS